MKWLRRLLRIPVTVYTTKRKPTDFDRRREEMCQRLANEIGRTWPPKVAQ